MKYLIVRQSDDGDMYIVRATSNLKDAHAAIGRLVKYALMQDPYAKAYSVYQLVEGREVREQASE